MRKTLAVSAVVLACTMALCACGTGEQTSADDDDIFQATLAAFDDYDHFGTMTRWVYVREKTQDAQAIWDKLTARADEIENSVSTEIEESDISRFNAAAAGERVSIDADTWQMLTVAKEVYEETSWQYNPATGLLVDLWGFSPRHRKANYAPELPYDREDFLEELPAEKYLKAFSSESVLDFSKVELGQDEQGYYVVKPADAQVEVDGVVYTMQLNLSGIGKGFCADEGTKILQDAGQKYGYYNLGASSMVLLSDPSHRDTGWSVSVTSPRYFSDSMSYATLRAHDIVLSTSGDYEQYYELEGTRYCHIVDPNTGYPIGAAPSQSGSYVVCATVIGGNAAAGDARATALCCMTLDEALSYSRAHSSDFKVLFVWYEALTNEYIAYSNLENWTLEEPSMRAEVIA